MSNRLNVPADTLGRRKEKSRRKARRDAKREELAKLKRVKNKTPEQQERIRELEPARPPEPVVFAWFDWVRVSGNIMHAGRRKFQYRFATLRAEVVAAAFDEKTRREKYLVRLPVTLAMEIFGR